MAEEYDETDLAAGWALLTKLQKDLAKANKILKTRIDTDRANQKVPAFSKRETELADIRDDLTARIAVLSTSLKVQAAKYKPSGGASQTLAGQLSSAKANERQLDAVKNILASPTPVAPAVVAPAVSAPPSAVTGAGQTPVGYVRVDGTTPGVPVKPVVVTPTGVLPTESGVPARKAWVDAQLVSRNLVDTPANRKKLRGEYVPAKTVDGKPVDGTTLVVDTAWEGLFKQDNPGYAFMFTAEMKTKYPDLFKLFQEASADKGFDPELFKRRFEGSSWGVELRTGQKGRQVMAALGSLTGWGSGNLAKFLTKAQQFSWEGDNLKFEAYKELFAKGAGGKYANEAAVKELQASTPYMRLAAINKAYYAPLDDERIVKVLTGEISENDFMRLNRELAKGIYTHLAPQIDAGLTIADMANGYRRIAAETLELDPDGIDMSSAKFNKAMKFGEGGKERMLSTGEWEQMLRTDPQYGFSKTKAANRDATNIGLSIAKMFGKVGG